MPERKRPSGPPSPSRTAPPPKRPTWLTWVLRIVLWCLGLAAAGVAAAACMIAVALAVAYPNLPDVSDLSDYRPKLPLRVFSSEGVLIGEFGEERRNLTPIGTIPQVMKDAVLAAEDSRFYSHGGVDYKGVMRAGLANLNRVKSQGASTISMQVARNVYLSSEKTFTRKIYEILLTFKLEHQLSKDQILEIYLNQIYLGNRAYGFAAASEAYFGKPLKDITVAEAAMLAGLPKAPGANNPVSNPTRARARQLYVIDRMVEAGFITEAQAQTARAEHLHLRERNNPDRLHAEYVAEMVRQMMYAQYGDETYTRGLEVYTSITAVDQAVAYEALRKGIMDYERKQIYRGPEKFIELPSNPKDVDEAVDDALAEHPDNGDVLAAVVISASPKEVVAMRGDGETIRIEGDGLRPARSGLAPKAQPKVRIVPGAVIRVARGAKDAWEITQLPEVEGAFVAMDPRDGSIKALVGGFDFYKNKFNHVTQAWRQPGSSFKPFIYSAALEKGFTPSTVINDGPLFFDASTTGGQPWEPKNYGGGFDGPMSMRRALAKSKNMVSIRILQSIGTHYAQDWITNFGFDREKHPAYLPMALGAGAVTPMQLAVGYSVFANGGYRVNPALITRVTDHRGKVLLDLQPPLLNETMRAIPARNAFIMDSLLQEVARSGTAANAQRQLKRPDLYGKTGTTNDSLDAWFAGFQPTLTAVAWMGYDTPRSLGDRETGGGLSLPIWINFMQSALKGVQVAELAPPAGVTRVGGEWYFDDYTPGRGIEGLGVEPAVAPGPEAGLGASENAPVAPPKDERNRILDLFRN
ncbi:penicillin-binding protein 1A [Variovorax sp.]|uniref:penicillin-binding protein 1A n=1 Tax=Variovorax sp. TaxID=1871043 RepID=UPI002D31E67F|nr:penicillin-binding protein 1A [Variovorax sp.]HYP82361.1 penicillin-binding protein 1A [Variovorax sp.]